jgi:hypothetical protein
MRNNLSLSSTEDISENSVSSCPWVFAAGIECTNSAFEDKRPAHIHPEDANCSACRNVAKPTTFDAAHPRNPKLCISVVSVLPLGRSSLEEYLISSCLNKIAKVCCLAYTDIPDVFFTS